MFALKNKTMTKKEADLIQNKKMHSEKKIKCWLGRCSVWTKVEDNVDGDVEDDDNGGD